MDSIPFLLQKNTKPAIFKKIGRFIFNILLVIGFNSFGTSQSIAQNAKIIEGYQIIKNLDEDWLVYDNQYKDYVPYINTRHYNFRSYSQYLQIENYIGYKLFIYSKEAPYLFINGIFQKKLPISQWVDFDLDSLSKKQNSPSKILLTVYSENPGIEDCKILIGGKITQAKFVGGFGNEGNTALKARKFSNFKNFAILFSLFLLGSVTFLYNFQYGILTKFINLKDLFTVVNRTDSIIVNRPFDLGNILYLIILSFGISLILLIMEYNFISIIPKAIINSENPTFLNLTGQFFNLSFLAFVVFLLKYFFIATLGNLYHLEKITNIHFFKNLQSTGIFACLFLFCITLLIIYPIGNFQSNKLNYLIIITSFYLLRLFLLFFIIIKANPVKNLYLFSYLCIVELIPLFIGIRFVL